ncbi:MAG TPA: NAD(P)-binding domain-containing protein, partial [Actinopolymorphaceae bacterium]|nr:NAD(P)-binding domain-containing protein [Actinopolymorphaceae bacterium]
MLFRAHDPTDMEPGLVLDRPGRTRAGVNQPTAAYVALGTEAHVGGRTAWCAAREVSVDGRVVDYFVIGAGPAGLQLGYFLHRAGRDYVVAESGEAPGTFFTRFPRHRQMISINKPHTGIDDPELTLRWDWNSLLSDDPALRFTRYTGRYFPHADDYLRYLADFATTHGLHISYRTRIVDVAREPTTDEGQQPSRGLFVLTDESGRHWRARRVIVAT